MSHPGRVIVGATSGAAFRAVLLVLPLVLAGCSDGSSSSVTADCGQRQGGNCNLDRDGDGQVSREEWDAAFTAADVDGNGQLNQSEVEAARSGGGGGGGHGR